MTHTKGIKLTFRAFGKSGQTAFLTHSRQLFPASGKYFMGIGLMTHIPHQSVMGGIKYIMQGNGELNHAQASTKMAAAYAHGIQHKSAQFIGQLQ